MSLFHDNLVEVALIWNLHFEDTGKVQWITDELSFEEAEGRYNLGRRNVEEN